MIKIYKINLGNSSTKKTLEWLDSHHICYKTYPLLQIHKKDLNHILELSTGFDEILRPDNKGGYGTIEKELDLEKVTTSEMIDYILKNPYVLKTPIIFDENKLLVGYNETEIRQFVPSSVRKFNYDRFFK